MWLKSKVEIEQCQLSRLFVLDISSRVYCSNWCLMDFKGEHFWLPLAWKSCFFQLHVQELHQKQTSLRSYHHSVASHWNSHLLSFAFIFINSLNMARSYHFPVSPNYLRSDSRCWNPYHFYPPALPSGEPLSLCQPEHSKKNPCLLVKQPTQNLVFGYGENFRLKPMQPKGALSTLGANMKVLHEQRTFIPRFFSSSSSSHSLTFQAPNCGYLN